MMRLLTLIAVSGHEGALLDLATLSAEREGAHVALLLGEIPHGAKLDAGRKLNVGDYDAVVCMDSDVVVWPGWRSWIEQCLNEPGVVACGAPRVDSPVGLHPSMLAMPRDLFLTAPSFLPTPGNDTGVEVARWLSEQGEVRSAPMARHAGGWWDCVDWWHLGSGSASEYPGDTQFAGWEAAAAQGHPWFTKHVQRVRRRQQFIHEAKARLSL